MPLGNKNSQATVYRDFTVKPQPAEHKLSEWGLPKEKKMNIK